MFQRFNNKPSPPSGVQMTCQFAPGEFVILDIIDRPVVVQAVIWKRNAIRAEYLVQWLDCGQIVSDVFCEDSLTSLEVDVKNET